MDGKEIPKTHCKKEMGQVTRKDEIQFLRATGNSTVKWDLRHYLILLYDFREMNSRLRKIK